MIEFSLDGVKNILCLGAHSDDIEIGCGGTLLKLIRDHRDLNIWWVVFSAGRSRSREARSSAAAFLSGVTKKKIVVKKFRDSFFPFDGERIKDTSRRSRARFARTWSSPITGTIGIRTIGSCPTWPGTRSGIT